MPRQNSEADGREWKIRKRGCSPSSSSSLVRNYRLKRAILVRKRGVSSTPVPTWKMGSRSPPTALQNAKTMKYPPCKNLSVSARKLAATLWEINEVSSARAEENWVGRSEAEVKSRQRIAMASKAVSVVPHSRDPTHGPAAEEVGGASSSPFAPNLVGKRSKNERRDRSTAGDDHRRKTPAVPQLGGLDSINFASITEIETQSYGKIPSGIVLGFKMRLKDISKGLTASKELLKVLNHIWIQEEQCSSSVSLISALRFELDRARMQVDLLIKEQRSNRYEIDFLLKQFAEEKEDWKSKEQDRIHNAISSVAGELEVEKKLRRQTERLNKKLSRELAKTKASLSSALKELESEKRAREILDQVCDELARGIGEDRAEVEEMKRESAKVQEEIEKEREMLQLADVLREERVQMKLSEAKYEFEEKNAAVDKLKNELEAYLRTKTGDEKCDGSPNFSRIRELEEYLRKTLGASYQNEERKKKKGEVMNEEEHEGDDSADSDLHSIELNMDNNSKSYNWSTQNDSKRSSVDEKFRGRMSISEKIWRSCVSLERKTSDGIEWDFYPNNKSQENSDGFDRGRFLEIASESWRRDHEDEIERDEMVRDLRDHILSGARTVSSQGFACSNGP
ncbi:hypothetical protein U1Q18_032608 [Sarracenia purpurea var. burkii]